MLMQAYIMTIVLYRKRTYKNWFYYNFAVVFQEIIMSTEKSFIGNYAIIVNSSSQFAFQNECKYRAYD